MGSGCKGDVSGKVACTQVISTDCAIYQGDSIPLLGICCGDTVTEVEEAIIQKLLEVLNGTGITVGSVTLDNCVYLKTLFGNKSKSLGNLLQLLVDSECNLRELIAQLDAKVNPIGAGFQFDLKCLDSSCCPSTSITRDQIIQMLINKVCEFAAIIDELENTTGGITNTINNTIGNYLGNAINSCGGNGIKKTGAGADTKISIVGMPPPETYLPYFGPLSLFDSSGKGLDGTPACGWFIANGNNGTKDMRGYTFAGATNGVGGNTLDARVNPDILNQPTAASTYGDKKGEMFSTLTIQQIPSHNHTATTSSSSVTIPFRRWGTRPQGGGAEVLARMGASTGAEGTGDVSITATPNVQVTIGNTGGSQPHNNVQPTAYGVWICRFD